jgi:ankyrin repeat protein
VLFAWLLNHGADPNDVDQARFTPMTRIAHSGSLVSLQLLFKCGAQIDNNALHAAVRRPKSDPERIPILELLLSQGADINALETGLIRPSSSALRKAHPPRTTPLYEAAKAQDVELVEFLMKRGADPKVRTRWGEWKESSSALGYLIHSKNERLREMGMNVQSGLDSLKTEAMESTADTERKSNEASEGSRISN